MYRMRKLETYGRIGGGHRWWIGLGFENGKVFWADQSEFDQSFHKLADSGHGKITRTMDVVKRMEKMDENGFLDYAIMNDGDHDEWSWGDSYRNWKIYYIFTYIFSGFLVFWLLFVVVFSISLRTVQLSWRGLFEKSWESPGATNNHNHSGKV